MQRGIAVASNFRILFHRNSDNLHLKLSGDFDISSAHELLDVIKQGCRGASKIIIHTNSLRKIYPFALNTFQKDFSGMEGLSAHILFTGEFACQICPKKGLCL